MKRIAMLASLSASVALAANPNEFEIFNYDLYSNGTVDIPGRLFVPDDYDPSQSYPVVIFLHGMGERGTDNTDQVNSNINNLLAAAKSRDFFIYAPQTPGGWNPRSFMKPAAGVTTTYNIDLSRMYVTGLSMGGGGAWDTLISYADVMAAGVPICGVAPDATGYMPLVGEPIWAYHARNDTTVGVGTTRNRINDIRAADGGKPPLSFPLDANPSNPYHNTGAPYYSDGSTFYSENNLRYTEYADGGHGIWGRVYNESAMYDWLLSQSTPVPTLQPGESVYFDLGEHEQSGPDAAGRYWNSTLNGEQATVDVAIPFAKSADGHRTSVILEVIAPAGKSASNHLNPGDLPQSVWSDAWSVYTFQDAAELRLHGLVPGGEYMLEFFGSHADDDGGRGRISRFIVGDETIDLDLVGNIGNAALFESVFADINGMIDIEIDTGPGSRYAFVNWFSVTAVPEPAVGLIGIPAILLMARHRHRRDGSVLIAKCSVNGCAE